MEDLVEIDGIGEVLAQAWTAFFSDGKNNTIVDHLLAELTFEAGDEESSEGADEAFAGMNSSLPVRWNISKTGKSCRS